MSNMEEDYEYEYKISASDKNNEKGKHKRKERSRSSERRRYKDDDHYGKRRKDDRKERSTHRRHYTRDSEEKDYVDNSRRGRDRKHERNSPYYESNKYDDWDQYDNNNRHSEIPNNTIRLWNLPSHIQELDIQLEVNKLADNYKDVRLMKDRETGASRRFAFVEFHLLSDAVRWMEATNGVITIDGHRITLNYSPPRPDPFMHETRGEWICAQCGICNFKKREYCFKCNIPKEESDKHFEVGKEGISEISMTPSKVLLLRGLELCTTPESIIEAIRAFTYSPVVDIQIAQDPLSLVSRGFCFVEFMSVKDASDLFASLTQTTPSHHQDTPLSVINASDYVNGYLHVHSKKAIVCYAKSASASLAIVNANLAAQRERNQLGSDGANHLQITKSYLARTAVEQAQAMKLSTFESHQRTASRKDCGNAGKEISATPQFAMPKGLGQETFKYPNPDTSTYRYDSTSGYYYDPATRLYYDANSKYYYNGEIQKFLYWDASKRNYFLVPTTSANDSAVTATAGIQAPATTDTSVTEGNGGGKANKTKDAQRIAREMEKWAKSQNQKKDSAPNANSANPNSQDLGDANTETADAGYAVLERVQGGSMQALFSQPASLSSLLAYNQDTDSDGDVAADPTGTTPGTATNDAPLIDEHILACLLCKRQFKSKDILIKHIQLSSLHKQNLAKYKAQMALSESSHQDASVVPSQTTATTVKYRDRAKERREKFGDTEAPELSNQLTTMIKNQLMAPKKNAPLSVQNIVAGHANVPKIGEDNIGNRMLQSMGWKEGSGLGKSQQGIVDPIGPTMYGGDTKIGLGNAVINSSDALFASLPGTYQDKTWHLTQERFHKS